MATKSGSGSRKAAPARKKPSGPVTAQTAKARATKRPPASVAVLDDDELDVDEQETEAESGTETDTQTDAAAPSPTTERKPWPVRLYLGEIGYDFIGKRKFWYGVSAVVILICLGSMIFRQFNLGVEFAGGERFRSPGSEQQLADVTAAVEDVGAVVTSAQSVGNDQLVLITADLSEEQGTAVTTAIADTLGVATTDVANSTTSASWGRDVTSKAVQGLLVFLVLVLVFLAVRFQWKMAVGAMVALIHDLVITAGIYSLVGFEVTPASVIGLLTILGFSLYDTVVVFDKVDENTKGLLANQRRTYSAAANLAINQVLMRSINTSIFALLPVLGLLYAGVFLIGEGTLQDLALVLFVGMLAGIYSSIFLAAPVLCDLKEREPEYRKLAQRVAARQAGGKAGKRAAKAALAGARSAGSRRAATAGLPDTSDPDAGEASDPDDDASALDADGVRHDRVDDEDRVDGDDVHDDDHDDDDAADPQDDAVPVGGTVVASARRSGPRSSRRAVSATSAGGTATSATSAGSRLAPRPGAKPTRGARTRGGSGKRNR